MFFFIFGTGELEGLGRYWEGTGEGLGRDWGGTGKIFYIAHSHLYSYIHKCGPRISSGWGQLVDALTSIGIYPFFLSSVG